MFPHSINWQWWFDRWSHVNWQEEEDDESSNPWDVLVCPMIKIPNFNWSSWLLGPFLGCRDLLSWFFCSHEVYSALLILLFTRGILKYIYIYLHACIIGFVIFFSFGLVLFYDISCGFDKSTLVDLVFLMELFF